MKKIMIALAAMSMSAAPAAANHSNMGNGNAYGKGPRVCLITYDTALMSMNGQVQGLPAERVTKAQYLPLGVALAKDTSMSAIVTYGSTGATGGGIEIARVQYDDATVDGINFNSTTEEACTALADYVDMRDDD